MLMTYNYLVNHPTYPTGPTSLGKTACRKRPNERVLAKVTFTMNRLTNLYNSRVGYEIPLYIYNVQDDLDYVVSKSFTQSKQPALIKRLREESSKVNIRRKYSEFGISRNTKVLGRRRIHSTSLISGKESRSMPTWITELSGSLRNVEFDNLIQNIQNDSICTNLSVLMTDPNFLLACWVRIRSNKGALTKALSDESLDGLNYGWFEEVAKGMRNGSFNFKPYRRTYIPKPNGKKRPLTIPSPKDKIVQEAMKFLLEMIYEPDFRECSHAFRPGRGCDTALNSIKVKFNASAWFIEGDIEQQYPSINHHKMVRILKTKINDQAFIDLIWKYMKTVYGEIGKQEKVLKIGLVQGGILSPVLSNIYMHPFDEWMEDVMIPSFNKGKVRRTNPEYLKLWRKGEVMAKHQIRKTDGHDPNFRRMSYVRYVDDFLIGIIGDKQDCIEVREKIKEFLEINLNLTLSIEKSKITHSTKDSALFLGYRIHGTPLSKMPVRYNKLGNLTRRATRMQLDGPIDRIVKRLHEKGFAKKSGNPTRNGKFIHLNVYDMIEHFKSIERGILNYYGLASNYGRVAARVHYILKYSCALTIASKMRLKTLRRVFRKYGRNLIVKTDGGKTTSYPSISYKKPNKLRLPSGTTPDDMVEKLTYRIGRGRKDIDGPCIMCGSLSNIEIHHVKRLSKTKTKDWLTYIMVKMNRKQIPLCSSCHKEYHKGNLNIDVREQ
jgi:group II intron reverse transcriptase/maturase